MIRIILACILFTGCASIEKAKERHCRKQVLREVKADDPIKKIAEAVVIICK